MLFIPSWRHVRAAGFLVRALAIVLALGVAGFLLDTALPHFVEGWRRDGLMFWLAVAVVAPTLAFGMRAPSLTTHPRTLAHSVLLARIAAIPVTLLGAFLHAAGGWSLVIVSAILLGIVVWIDAVTFPRRVKRWVLERELDELRGKARCDATVRIPMDRGKEQVRRCTRDRGHQPPGDHYFWPDEWERAR